MLEGAIPDATGAYGIGDPEAPTGQQCGMSTLDFEVATEDGLRSIGVVTGVGSGACV